MSNNRLLYSSQSIFATPGISGSGVLVPSQLHRVLSVNHGDAVTRTDVTVFGQRAPIDRLIVESPTSSVDISYLATDGHNEQTLGLLVNNTGVPTGSWASALSSILSGTRDEQNYFIKVVDQAQDSDLFNDGGSPYGVIGFGNGSLGAYSVEARVGGFPTASARIAGLNLQYTMATGITGGEVPNPSIDPTTGAAIDPNTLVAIPEAPTQGAFGQVTAVRPGDIALIINNNIEGTVFGLDMTTLCPQSFTFTMDLNREALRCLGTKFRYANEINFPVTATFSMEILVRDLQAGRLADYLCSDVEIPIDIKLRSPECGSNNQPIPGTDDFNVVWYSLRGARYDGTTFNNGVGNGETATVNYSISIGGPHDTAHGLFMAGVNVV